MPTTARMAAAIQRLVARRRGAPKVRAFSWWLVRLAAPFVATLRQL